MILASLLSARNRLDASGVQTSAFSHTAAALSKPPLPVIPSSSAVALSDLSALACERRESEATETQGQQGQRTRLRHSRRHLIARVAAGVGLAVLEVVALSRPLVVGLAHGVIHGVPYNRRAAKYSRSRCDTGNSKNLTDRLHRKSSNDQSLAIPARELCIQSNTHAVAGCSFFEQ